MADSQTDANVDTLLGRTVVEMGLATKDEVDAIVQQQKNADDPNQRSLGQALIDQGVVTEKQMQRAREAAQAKRSDQQIPGFQLLEKLGAGAMASVFKARQVSLDRIVAIKVMPKKFVTDPGFVERFYAEGRAAAKLNHPNIVQAIDVGKAGDFHYFVMEYVEGHSVYDHLVERARYSEEQALEIVIQMAEALRHAHEKGFMHRDVKPKNIMITTGGTAKLADMGLARQVSDKEAAEAEAGRAYGTPYYISPEQIRGQRDIDFRCDIYALGATFYHMVTGKVPFDAPNPSAVMHKHLKEPLTPPDHVNDQLSAGIGEIIEVMMAKDPDERYRTTADLLEDLKSVAAGEPPMQARQRFEVSQLAHLEATGQEVTPANHAASHDRAIVEQPLFWALVASLAMNIILLILLLANL
jgi:serine/threonine-protein kinase